MTHRLSNRCRVEKTNEIFLLIDSSHFLVYDRKQHRTRFTFFLLYRSPRKGERRFEREQIIGSTYDIAKKSVPRNGSHENKCVAIPKWPFFFQQLVEVVTFFGTMIWKNSAGYDYLSWD